MNVRSGPGTDYPVVASATAGTSYEIVGQNEDGTWWQVCCFDQEAPGWLAASLVNVLGDSSGVAVVEDIPEQPVAAAPSTTSGAGSGGALPSGILIYSVANLDAEKWELWEYNFSTGQSRWLFDWRTEVAYSPDYSQIAYFAWPPAAGGENTGVWIMGADYSGERMVIPGGAAYPSWSPDGGRLVLQGGPDMYIVTADGSSGWKMTTGEYPAWAPNSNWIAHRACVGGGCGIYVTNPDTGDQRRLTSGGSDGQPAWSPNGQQIAYISQDHGNFEIYRINLDGSNKVRLTSSGTSDGLPVWSPDGQWIAFRSDRDGQWAVYIMRSDGSNVRKIVDAPVLPLWFFEKMGWRR
jgi:TolB protein